MTVKTDPIRIMEEVLAHIDRVLGQFDFMSSALQAERRKLFDLMMQLKTKE